MTTTYAETRSPPATSSVETTRDYISFSAISTYQQCPLRYFFKYVAGLPEEMVSASLVFGGAIHGAAEFHFNELMAGNPAPDLNALMTAYWDEWRARDEQAVIQYAKNENDHSMAKTAERILRAFQMSDLSNPDGRILGVEEELRGELTPGVPELLARIDLIVETEDALTITDLKTARSRWKSGQAEDSGEQLLLYSELARALAPEKEVRLEFAVITKAANPVAERHPVTPDPKRIARTKQIVRSVWNAIESGHFFPSPSPIACASCPYREPCRRWGG